MGNNNSSLSQFKTLLTNKKDKSNKIFNYAKSNEFNSLLDDENGWNGLMYAIDDNRTDLIDVMISNGANVSIVSKDTKVTPLLLAIQRGLYEIASKIISIGCDVNITDINGNNAYMLACKTPKMKNIAQMIWLKYGLQNLNLYNSDFDTPFILTCSAGLESIAREMIKQNVNILHKNAFGRTARDYAVVQNMDQIVKQIDEIKNMQNIVEPICLPSAPLIAEIVVESAVAQSQKTFY